MPKRALLAVALILAFVLGGSFPGASQSPQTQQNETPSGWFVELASAPLADVDGSFTAGQRQSYLSRLASEQQAFRTAARAAGITFQERRAFSVLFNGLAIDAGAGQLPALSRLSGVKALWPIATYSIPPTPRYADPDLETALAMTGADVAQSELGYTGAGVKVAVMDTGIDYDHAALGGDGVTRTNSMVFPTGRVVAGYDFVGDAFNADRTSPFYNPTPTPDAYPDDCHGHGTHVAGIVGASGAVTGVAPGVKFGAYRVFGCDGSTTADIMIAAMERALADGMHVLNMSIGSAFQWPQYPTGAASDRLVNKGMVVVASIGNSGGNGLYSAGTPGLGSKVIGVASYDNSHVDLSIFTISPDNTQIGYGVAASAPAPPTSGTWPMKRTGTATTTNDACAPLAPGFLTGHVALIRRGTCTFHTKSLNAQNAGAVAVVLYNNVPGRFSPTVAGSPPITIPVVAISDTEGVLINNRLAAGPVDMTWTSLTGKFLNPTGGLISSFSSYGLSPDLALKPDIGAPGGLIRSTYPLEKGGVATVSGTSMSSPHVAGGAALLLQAKPNTPSQAMRAILQNSADPKPWWGNPGLGFLDNVHRQGAGMLDIDDAILATTKIEPGKLSLGESEPGPATRRLYIENSAAWPVTYDLSHQPALATGSNTFSPSFSASFASVGFSASSVLVPAKGSAYVDVTITAPASPLRGLYGGYIAFTPQGGGQVYRVPYAGFIGDYQSIQVLNPTGLGFPWLSKLTACTTWFGLDCVVGGTWTNQPPGTAFTFTNAFNVPQLLLHFDHQARRLRMEVFEATTGRAEGRALEMHYVARNSTSSSFFAFPWDGTTMRGNSARIVPNGQYVMKISVQKALGDDGNPAHWETWTSPMFVINRPPAP